MNYNTAKQIVGSDLGQASKMPTKTWGISASKCVTGIKLSKLPNSSCGTCYAKYGKYPTPVVMDCHERRLQGIDHPLWVDAMVYLMQFHSLSDFRWFDSGDIQSLEHLQKIVTIARKLPQVKFWCPTQERKFLSQFLKTDTIPTNIVFRLSRPFINMTVPKKDLLTTTSSVLTKDFFAKTVSNARAVKCMAKSVAKDHPSYGKCGTCRACWDSTVDHIYYLKH